MNELIQLFAVFARIGAVTFGGGYAMLPILQAEVVEKYHWASEEELADYYAVGQCTPGVIAVNTATFIGMKRKGVTGGIIATLGVVFPSLVIITVIAAFLSNFAQLQFVRDAFAGIRVCVCVLIFNAIKKLAKGALVDKLTIGLFLLVMGINLFSSISPAWLVVLAGVVGLLAKKREVSCNVPFCAAVLGILQNRPVRHRRRHGHHSLPGQAGYCHRLVHRNGSLEHDRRI